MGKKKIITKSETSTQESEKMEAKIRKGKVDESATRLKDGVIYISCSYNNTIVSLADNNGNVVSWVSAGSVGFKGTRKGTPYAASQIADTVATLAEKKGIGKIAIKLRGIGTGRDSAVRAITNHNFEIISIQDLTSVPHNGCRPKKPRRV